MCVNVGVDGWIDVYVFLVSFCLDCRWIYVHLVFVCAREQWCAHTRSRGTISYAYSIHIAYTHQYTLHVTFVYGSIKYLCIRRTLFSFPISLACSFSNTWHCSWVSFSLSSNNITMQACIWTFNTNVWL